MFMPHRALTGIAKPILDNARSNPSCFVDQYYFAEKEVRCVSHIERLLAFDLVVSDCFLTIR